MHPCLGKDDQGVARPDGIRELEAVLFHFQGRHPLMPYDGQLVPAVPDDLRQETFGVRGGAGMDLFRTKPQDGRRPGTAPVPVRDHLALIDDRDIIVCFQVSHLHGGGLHPAERNPDLFLPGYQGTGDIIQVQGLKLFGCQQPQGTEVQAVLRTAETLGSFIGFTGVGGPQVKEKTAFHLPREGIQIPVVLRDSIQQRGTDPFFPPSGGVRGLLETDQLRVFLQQAADPFPGKTAVQGIEYQALPALRLPADRRGDRFARRKADIPARAELREGLSGFRTEEGFQGAGPESRSGVF